jgi:hypothetical protein
VANISHNLVVRIPVGILGCDCLAAIEVVSTQTIDDGLDWLKGSFVECDVAGDDMYCPKRMEWSENLMILRVGNVLQFRMISTDGLISTSRSNFMIMA